LVNITIVYFRFKQNKTHFVSKTYTFLLGTYTCVACIILLWLKWLRILSWTSRTIILLLLLLLLLFNSNTTYFVHVQLEFYLTIHITIIFWTLNVYAALFTLIACVYFNAHKSNNAILLRSLKFFTTLLLYYNIIE